MKVTKLNNGFYKLGKDEYRVEAPMAEPSTYRLEDFTLPNGRAAQRYVTVKRGKKLRSHAGRDDEVEPTMWHLYKMRHFERMDNDGVMQPKTSLDILDDNFIGTAKQAIAVCEAHKAGG